MRRSASAWSGCPGAASTTRSCGSSCATCRATSCASSTTKALREYKRRALHFQLDTRRPDVARPPRQRRAGAPRRRSPRSVANKLRKRPLRRRGSIATRIVALGAAVPAARPTTAIRGRGRRRRAMEARSTAFGVSRTFASTPTRRSTSTRGSPASSVRTGRARRRCSRRSRGRCTATPPRAARARSHSLQARRPRAPACGSSSTSSSAGTAIASVRGLTNAELYLDGAAAPDRGLGQRRERPAHAPARHDARGVLQHVLHRAEGAERDGGDGAVGARAVPLARARLRAAARGAGARARGSGARSWREIAGLRQGMPDAATRWTRQLAEARAPPRRRRRSASDAARGAHRERRAHAWPRSRRAGSACSASASSCRRCSRELRVAESEARAADARRRRGSRASSSEIGARARGARGARCASSRRTRELHAEFQRLEALAREEGRRQTLLETRAALADELSELRERRAEARDGAQARGRGRARSSRSGARSSSSVGGPAGGAAAPSGCATGRRRRPSARRCATQYAELQAAARAAGRGGRGGRLPHLRAAARRALPAGARAARRRRSRRCAWTGMYFKRPARAAAARCRTDVKTLDERRRALFSEVSTLERRLTKVQLAVQELAQLGGEIAAKEQREAQLARELDAIPAGYDAARHVRGAAGDRSGSAARRAGDAPRRADRARARASCGSSAQLPRGVAALDARRRGLRARREAVDGLGGGVHELREPSSSSARGGAARGGARRGAARTATRRARPRRSRSRRRRARELADAAADARRAQRRRSGCTTSSTARTPTSAPISTSSCGPNSRSSRARSSPSSPTGATPSWSSTTATTSWCSRTACRSR